MPDTKISGGTPYTIGMSLGEPVQGGLQAGVTLVSEAQANSPAAKAGIASGDVIVSVDGASVGDGASWRAKSVRWHRAPRSSSV